MAKKLGVLVVFTVLVTFFSGCATDVASVKLPHWDKKPIGVYSREYTILGTVKLEKGWFGVLGYSIPIIGIDNYLYQSGGATYADLLAEARKQYPEADAVIDIVVDYKSSIYAAFYAERHTIVTGIAIKYERNPPPPNSAMDIHLK